jgi:hypothetical protein
MNEQFDLTTMVKPTPQIIRMVRGGAIRYPDLPASARGRRGGQTSGDLPDARGHHALRPGVRTVLFLVCDEGAFITGSTISVNGGQHMY